jgi:23S rRNA (guanine2445-N2)-methyltransferase / 23S rRNA (guanine2069-N7)-methyltransferase
VDLRRPSVRVNVYLHRDEARLALDLAGEGLHRRGYRAEGVAAPLKENLAAAILLGARWPELARSGSAFLDPMCGSGTLPIEAALMAADIAPGLLRSYFGFLGWRGHRPEVWEKLLAEARERRANGLRRLPPIAGSDADPRAVRVALANVQRAGLEGCVGVQRRDLEAIAPPQGAGKASGLLAVNPPYGERIGRTEELAGLYIELGRLMRERFAGWRLAVFTGNPGLAQHIHRRCEHTILLYNGALPCRLLVYEAPRTASSTGAPHPLPATASAPGAEMLANRLRKNLRRLGRWAKREGIRCYRLYDADLPEYALAVDVYVGEQRWVHVQEYAPPPTVDADRAGQRLDEALAMIAEVLAPAKVFTKVRRRQRGSAQYARLAAKGELHEVREGPCRFLVNFTDYLDTGLFLDHRPTRELVGRLASGRRFLNLFGYTGTATVYAALGDATASTTLDLSARYLNWASRNFALNGLDASRHALVKADCLTWLEEAVEQGPEGRYGLIFLDPPTFSNSKGMREAFDVQRDHVRLLSQATRLLEPDGELIFSTNRRDFRMDAEALKGLRLEDITRATLPPDFARSPRIHRCWRITHVRIDRPDLHHKGHKGQKER